MKGKVTVQLDLLPNPFATQLHKCLYCCIQNMLHRHCQCQREAGERLKHNHGQIPSPNPNSSSYCQNKEVQKQIKNRSQPIKTTKNQLVPFQTHLLVKQETSPPAQRGQNPFLNDHFGLSSPATNTRGLSRALFQYASPSASQLPIN